jgi:ribosome maturation factor RimP
MPDSRPQDELRALLTSPLSGQGLDVEDIEVASAGRRKLVRVLVDKDGGVTLDDVAAATTAVSGLLDTSDVLDDSPYTLEVTSPGVDRPLTHARHWRRNVDRLVVVHRSDGSSCTGRIVEAGDTSAVLDVNGDTQTIPYADVAKARIEIEFNRPRSPTSASPDGGAGGEPESGGSA